MGATNINEAADGACERFEMCRDELLRAETCFDTAAERAVNATSNCGCAPCAQCNQSYAELTAALNDGITAYNIALRSQTCPS